MLKKVASALVAVSCLIGAVPAFAAENLQWNIDGYWQYYNDPDNLENQNGNVMRERLRLRLTQKLDDNTKITVRFKSGDNWYATSGKYADSKNTYMDQYSISHKNGNNTFTVGRIGPTLGQGLLADFCGDLEAFDFTNKSGNMTYNAFIGRKIAPPGAVYGTSPQPFSGGVITAKVNKDLTFTGTYVNINAVDAIQVGTYPKLTTVRPAGTYNFYAVGGRYHMGNDVHFTTEFARNSTMGKNGYFLKLNKGDAWWNNAKVGHQEFDLWYFDVDQNAVPRKYESLRPEGVGNKGVCIEYQRVIAPHVWAGVAYWMMKDKVTDQDKRTTRVNLEFRY